MSDKAEKNEAMKLPTCVGFIMDGNRRWAKDRGLSTEEGHRAGVEVFRQMVRNVREAHIPHAVFYAFSAENWQRAPDEVQSLLGIFMEILQQRQEVRVRIIGERRKFSKALQGAIEKVERETFYIDGTIIWIALSYGGRQEILAAVNQVVARGVAVKEEDFSRYLWSAGMPDPDLIIRTGGEKRLSNFLPWQSIYSELIFTDTYWPAFTTEEFTSMLNEYTNRHRRHGK
jgi:undecaprenyl diphosphate synthase